MSASATKPFTYDSFEPGKHIGENAQTYTPQLTAGWGAIFGTGPERATKGAEGAGVAVVMMMRAYLSVVSPRPPGNVHARQQLALRALPRPGETVRTVVGCRHKEMKRERRYVELNVTGTGDGDRPIYDGVLTLIWAA